MKPDLSIKLFGLIGKPLDASPSPRFYNAVFKKSGLNCRYLPFEVEAPYLKNLITCMKLVDLQGLNVTIPFKEKVVPFLDGLDRSAKLCGAVNTIVRKKNRFIGHNTDGAGFLTALKKYRRFDPKNKTIIILGAGGAARAIGAALAGKGAKKIFILNRHLARAKRAAAFLAKNFPKTEWAAHSLSLRGGRRPTKQSSELTGLLRSLRSLAMTKPDLIVQTTPAALKLPAPFFDIRPSTKDGRRMLVCQARLNLKLWLKGEILRF